MGSNSWKRSIKIARLCQMGLIMRAPFIVFYRYQGQEYNAVFDTMRKAKQFARLTGGRIESRLTNLLEG